MTKDMIIEVNENNTYEGVIPIETPSRLDAGYDIRTQNKVIIAPNDRITINVPIKWQPPTIPFIIKWLARKLIGANPVWVGRILPRSGLAVKQGINTLAGVIDEGYRGEFGIVLHNTSTEYVTLEANDKIAQLVLFIAFQAEIVNEKVDNTSRGSHGFGSTGK